MKTQERNTTNNRNSDPYLSIVVASRNDEHGGNTLRRTQVSFSGLLGQLEKYHIESELILVEWNPPSDRPLLKDVLKWPDKLKYCTIRVIVVPPSIHRRYKYSDKTPMHVTVAVNSGIMRSRGQFVLPGVIDLLYSDELMFWIALKKLKSDERYRVNRCDVDRNVLQYDTLKEQLDFCKQNIIQINSHLHDGPRHGLPDLHTNACGDFQLIYRDYWFLLHGYREGDIAAAHVDGLFSYAAYVAGVKEVILNDPMRIYHIDHDDKYTERQKEIKPRFEKLLSLPFIPGPISGRIVSIYRKIVGNKTKTEVYRIPTLSSPDFLRLCRDIVTGKRSYVFNDEKWGLAGETLKEFTVRTADWEKKYEKN